MANIKGLGKDTKHRLAIIGAFEQKGENKKGVKMTGYNIAFRMCNDTLTKKDIEAGKGQTAPMLAYDSYTDKSGEKKTSFTRPYSKDQYDAIMAAANTKGDKPVIEACVFPKDNGLVVNTNSLSTPKKAYDEKKDKANTEKLRELAAEKRNERENQAEAEIQAENEGAEVSEPELS